MTTYGAAESDNQPARGDHGQANGKSCLIVLVIVVVTGSLSCAYLTRGGGNNNLRGDAPALSRTDAEAAETTIHSPEPKPKTAPKRGHDRPGTISKLL